MILLINRVVFLPYGDFISIGPSWSGEVCLLIPKPLSVNWIFQHSCYVLSSISAETEGGKMDWAGARHFQLLGETSQLHFHSCSLEVREQTIQHCNHYPWLSITVNWSLAVILSSLLCSEMGLGAARMPEENGLESSGVRIMIMPLSASYHHPPIWQGPHWRCSWHSCRPSVCNKIQGWGNLNPVSYLFST